jgi:hypothetical protein
MMECFCGFWSFVIGHSSLVIRHSSFVIRHSSFVIRHSSLGRGEWGREGGQYSSIRILQHSNTSK